MPLFYAIKSLTTHRFDKQLTDKKTKFYRFPIGKTKANLPWTNVLKKWAIFQEWKCRRLQAQKEALARPAKNRAPSRSQRVQAGAHARNSSSGILALANCAKISHAPASEERGAFQRIYIQDHGLSRTHMYVPYLLFLLPSLPLIFFPRAAGCS